MVGTALSTDSPSPGGHKVPSLGVFTREAWLLIECLLCATLSISGLHSYHNNFSEQRLIRCARRICISHVQTLRLAEGKLAQHHTACQCRAGGFLGLGRPLLLTTAFCCDTACPESLVCHSGSRMELAWDLSLTHAIFFSMPVTHLFVQIPVQWYLMLGSLVSGWCSLGETQVERQRHQQECE